MNAEEAEKCFQQGMQALKHEDYEKVSLFSK